MNPKSRNTSKDVILYSPSEKDGKRFGATLIAASTRAGTKASVTATSVSKAPDRESEASPEPGKSPTKLTGVSKI